MSRQQKASARDVSPADDLHLSPEGPCSRNDLLPEYSRKQLNRVDADLKKHIMVMAKLLMRVSENKDHCGDLETLLEQLASCNSDSGPSKA